MGYIEDNLLDQEKIIYQTHSHKIIFLWPIIELVAAIGSFLAGVVDVAGILFLVALIHGIIVFIKYISSEFGLTNHRVIVKEGIIKRETQELFLKRIESIQVDQSVMGRMLNFGTISISGTGGQSDPFENIPDPLEFKKKVQEQLRDL